MEKIPILGVPINVTSYEKSTKKIIQWANEHQSHFVCAANVHMVMEAHDHMEFMDVLRVSDLVTPDGMPLVWMLRLKGFKSQTRVYGPTLMLYVLEMAIKEQIPVGFYGSDDHTLKMLLNRLGERFSGLKVAYAFSPPFRPLEAKESSEITENIIRSGVRILFVGLGCPKQEKWMAEQRGHLPLVMVGVGAAFDIHAGIKPQAPNWMQVIGMEWFFRLLHEPRRLTRRYFYNNPRFILLAFADLLGILDKREKRE